MKSYLSAIALVIWLFSGSAWAGTDQLAPGGWLARDNIVPMAGSLASGYSDRYSVYLSDVLGLTTTDDVGLGYVQNVLHAYNQTITPPVTADSSLGYTVGESTWSMIDAGQFRLFLMTDGTVGAAVWDELEGGGASAFTDLSDSPASYAGQAGKTVVVNGTEDGVEFAVSTGTDDQTIDVFSLSGRTINLSLESDGEATKTLDISGIVPTADQLASFPAGAAAADQMVLDSDDRLREDFWITGESRYTTTNYSGNPVLQDSTYHRRDPSRIIRVGDTLYIYYTRLDLNATNSFDVTSADIAYATAPALTGPWTEQGVVLSESGPGTFEDVGVLTPSMNVINDVYYLFYNALGSDGLGFQICLATATSPTGPFTKSPANPIIARSAGASWEDHTVASHFLLPMPDGSFRMYYKGRTSGNDRQIGLATASAEDFPATWTKYAGNPIFGFGVNGSPAGEHEDMAVIPLNGRYVMMTQHVANPSPALWYESLNGIDGWSESAAVDDITAASLSGTWAEAECMGYATAPLDGVMQYVVAGGRTASTKDGLGIWLLNGDGGVSGSGDVVGPASSTSGNIPTFGDTTGKLLADTYGVVATVGSPGSDTNLPTEQAVREAISAGGGGDVSGPGSSTNGYIPQWSGTSGTSLSAGLALSSFGGSTGLGLNNGSAYTNYGLVGDDSLNELFAAIDTALGTAGGGPPGSDGDVSYNNGGAWGKWAHWDDSSGLFGIGTDTPLTKMHLVGAGGIVKVLVDNYSDVNSDSPAFVGRAAKGTEGAPTTVDASKYLFQLTAQGYDGTAFAAGALLRIIPTETWGGSAHGTALEFHNVPAGTTTLTQAVRIKNNDIELMQMGAGYAVPATTRTGTITSNYLVELDTTTTTTAAADEVKAATSLANVIGVANGTISISSGSVKVKGYATVSAGGAVTKGQYVSAISGGQVAASSATVPAYPAPRIKILETTLGAGDVLVLIY